MSDLFAPLDDHPAYRQIANVIEQRIVGRSLRTGDPLPSETDLARQFGVNRSTIREAIRELETHGLLGRVRGEKRLRVTRPEPRRVSSGVSRALGAARCDLPRVVGSDDGDRARGRGTMRPRAARRRSSRLWCAPRAIQARSRRYRRGGIRRRGFFYRGRRGERQPGARPVAGAAQSLLAPTLTHIIDRVPQARARIRDAQARSPAPSNCGAASRRASGWKSTSAISSGATSSKRPAQEA